MKLSYQGQLPIVGVRDGFVAITWIVDDGHSLISEMDPASARHLAECIEAMATMLERGKKTAAAKGGGGT
jgi:hypothetical protein